MVRECFKVNTGILFKSGRLPAIGLDPSTLDPGLVKLPRPPPIPVDPQLHHWDVPKPSLIRRLLSPRKEDAPDPVRSEARSEEDKGLEENKVLEEEEDLKDALTPIYDQLKLEWPWWILEYIPMTFKHQHSVNLKEWESHYR